MSLDLRGLTPLLYVYDLQTSVRFYCDLLGFEVAMTSDPGEGEPYYWVMLRRGGMELMLNLA
jgi:glyoxylase I family protein